MTLPSSSPSETLDVFSLSSAWMAARKSNGEPGNLSGDLDERWRSRAWRTVRVFKTITLRPGWGLGLSHWRAGPLRCPVPYMMSRQWWWWLSDDCPGRINCCWTGRLIPWLSFVLRYIHHSNEVNKSSASGWRTWEWTGKSLPLNPQIHLGCLLVAVVSLASDLMANDQTLASNVAWRHWMAQLQTGPGTGQ